MSPDGKRVAVGGYGLKVSTVAILDRETGDTLAITWPRAPEGQTHHDAVMAVGFHPDGKRIAFGTADGCLWFWEPVKLDKVQDGRAWNAPVLAGRFPPDKSGSPYNFPQCIHFPDANTLVAVSFLGQVLACDLHRNLTDDPAAPIPDSKLLFFVNEGQEMKYPVDKAVSTGDGKWLIVATTGPLVLLRSADGKQTVPIKFSEGQFLRGIAVHPKTGKLAIGVASALPAKEAKPRFFMESNDEIWVYDNPTDPNAKPQVLPHAGRAEAMAFHPTENRLAIAGGDADEVTLLDLDKPAKPVSVVRGVGRRLYAVNLSENGEVIGVRVERNPKATDPNNRAAGEWVRFNVPRFTPTAGDVKWVGVRTTADGWEIVPHAKSRFVWYAERTKPDGTKERLQLGLDQDQDQSPTCFTFLPPAEGKPARILVGHYYGCSLFELNPSRLVKNEQTGDMELPRSKLFIGHGAEVNSIVTDKTGSWFVTAGSDHTVAAWSLEDWKAEPALGATFAVTAGQLVVSAVDVGSPAWEAGLTKGDQIHQLAIGGKLVYDDRPGKDGTGTAEATARLLARPQSGVEYYFGWQTPGQPDRRATPTRIKQRPLWKWFPAFDDHGRLTDSIIWMWHGSYYYTASVHGDRLVGWHVNDADPAKSPNFHPLERYKHLFLRPDVMSKLVGTRSVAEALKDALGDNPQRKSFRSVEPAPVEIVLKQSVVQGQAVPLVVSVNPLGNNPDLMPSRVELWVNDYRFKKWDGVEAKSITEDVNIPASVFRAGDNQITLIALNRLRGRAEAVRFVSNPAKPADPTLFGMAVGVDDYSAHRKAVGGVRAFGDLTKAREDASSFSREMLTYRGKGKFFPTGDLPALLNADASRESLLTTMTKLKQAPMKPDDLLVVFLAGHGDLLTNDGKVPPPPPMGVIAARGLPADTGKFVFCCPDYSPRKADLTALSGEELFDSLADINCRKLVLLDACHAGGATETNMLRRFIPNGQGPIVIAACDQSELSFEDDKLGHGVFTYAVLEALGPKFRAADANTDGSLSAAELYDYVADRVPELVSQLRPGNTQNPICFPHPTPWPKVAIVKR